MDPTTIGAAAMGGTGLIGSFLVWLARRYSTKQKALSDKRNYDLQVLTTSLDQTRIDIDRERADNDHLRSQVDTFRARATDAEMENGGLKERNGELEDHIRALQNHAEVVERDLLGRIQDQAIEPLPMRRELEPGSDPGHSSHSPDSKPTP